MLGILIIIAIFKSITSKINAVAIFKFFNTYTDENLLKEFMEPLLRYVVPGVYNFVESIGQPSNDFDKACIKF